MLNNWMVTSVIFDFIILFMKLGNYDIFSHLRFYLCKNILYY